MEINPDEYTGITSRLQLGASIKTAHNGCSSGAAMRITHSIDGMQFYCFKCREYNIMSSHNSPAERLRKQAILQAYIEARSEESYDLPEDCSQKIPESGLSWLGRAGWTEELIVRYNILWSTKLHRVVLPVVTHGVYMGYIARACESWQKPKYLEKCQAGAYWHSFENHECIQLYTAVTEDILSAGRCAAILPSYALLGTSLGTPLLNELVKYQKIFLWLDPDKGGRSGVKSMINRLRLFTEVQVVQSRDDPKRLTDTEIRSYL